MKAFFSFPMAVFLFVLNPGMNGQSKPGMNFTEKEYNFGTFRESDGIVTHDFKFTNTGKTPLIIGDVRASCGCTTPEWTREPVLPGKEGKIKVSYNPKKRPGSFSKTIQVSSNADIPLITLVVSGVVIPVDNMDEIYRYSIGEVRLQTIYAAFGEIYKGNVGTYSIKVMNTSGDKPVKLSFRQVPPHLDIRMYPEVIESQQEGRIEIEYRTAAQKDWDYTVDRIELLVNGQPVPNNRISVTANIRENFSTLTSEDMAQAPVLNFENTTFDFGVITPDKVVEYNFKLTNTGKTDLYIRKVSASCGCTAVQPSKTVITPGESTGILATFKAAGREGSQKKAITVITNDPKRSKTILWITGTVVKQETGQVKQ
jgi:hypothetical protein